MQGVYKLVPAQQEGIDTGQLVELIGEATYTTTAESVEVSVGPLTVIKGAWFTPKTVTHDPQDLLMTDGVISSGAITVQRAASGTSGLTFYYRIVGHI